MRRTNAKKKTILARNRNRLGKTLPFPRKIDGEKDIDLQLLEDEIYEENYYTFPYAIESEDRGENLATMNDPFMQGPERSTQIPPELPQPRTGNDTPQFNENLADRFDAERRSPPL